MDFSAFLTLFELAACLNSVFIFVGKTGEGSFNGRMLKILKVEHLLEKKSREDGEREEYYTVTDTIKAHLRTLFEMKSYSVMSLYLVYYCVAMLFLVSCSESQMYQNHNAVTWIIMIMSDLFIIAITLGFFFGEPFIRGFANGKNKDATVASYC